MKEKYLTVRKSDDFTTLIQIQKPSYFKKLASTGAVIERGITLEPVYDISRIMVEPEEMQNSISQPKLPYLIGHVAYVPFEDSKEALEIYRGIKRLANVNGELNINELETLGEKIRFIYNNAFYQRNHDKTTVTLKKIAFYCWIICGVLNTLQGKALLYTLNYLCAILQLDLFTLAQIIQSSTVSKEKKEYILNSLNSHFISSDIIDEDYTIGLYTRHNTDKLDEIIRKTR